MRNYTCAEYVNTANLRRILRARKVDRDQLAQLKSLEKRLRAQGGDHHRLDFALPDPQVCVDDLFGRLYPKRERGGSTPSLQGLKRDVRKALAHDQYTDVDMVNAHPVILSQLFLKLGLACPALERYVAEREAVLAETGLGRDEAKQVFLTLMYGGERKDPTPFMANFRDEFLTNATVVLASEAYERYRTLAEAKKPANVLGCGISFVAQDLERQLVCCAIQTLQSKGYEVGTIIHDGFLVRSLGVKDQDLRDAEEAVRHTHGYEVRFIKKSLGDFDESALWDPTDEYEGDADAASHTDLARAFLEWLEDRGHRLVRAEKKIYWYDRARRVPRVRETSPGEEVHERVPGFAQGEPRRDGVPVKAHRADRESPGGRPRLPRQDHRHDPQDDTLQQRRVLLRRPRGSWTTTRTCISWRRARWSTIPRARR